MINYLCGKNWLRPRRDAGGTVIACLIMNFLTFFYTDVFGLTPALVGTLFIALRVFDAIPIR